MVTASAVGYGLMRRGSAYLDLGGIEAFDTESLEDARAWLLAGPEPGEGEASTSAELELNSTAQPAVRKRNSNRLEGPQSTQEKLTR